MSGGGDHTEFAKFVRRILRAYGRRVHHSDPADLTELLAVEAAVQEAITNAVAGLRASGFSWAQIGEAAGISRQAAHKRWASSVG